MGLKVCMMETVSCQAMPDLQLSHMYPLFFSSLLCRWVGLHVHVPLGIVYAILLVVQARCWIRPLPMVLCWSRCGL